MKKISRFYPPWNWRVRAQVELLWWVMVVATTLAFVVLLPFLIIAIPGLLLTGAFERVYDFKNKTYATRELVNGRVQRRDIVASVGPNGETKYKHEGEEVEFSD